MYDFDVTGHLYTHVRLHTGQMYKCSKCGFTTGKHIALINVTNVIFSKLFVLFSLHLVSVYSYMYHKVVVHVIHQETGHTWSSMKKHI